MPNKNGWYSKEEVIDTRLPYYIPSSKRWTHEPYEFAILLTKSRSKEFGVPILSNDHEKPSAFRYAAAAGTGTDDKIHRYFPLYDRTEAFTSGNLDEKILYQHEIMGKKNPCSS